MKVRMTLAAVGGLALAAVILSAPTGLWVSEAIEARLLIDFNRNGLYELGESFGELWVANVPSDSTEIATVTDAGGTVKVPQAFRFENIAIQFRAGTVPERLLAWRAAIEQEKFETCPGELHFLSDGGEVASRFVFSDAWPCALRLKTVRLGFRGDVIEELEFALGSYEMVPADGGGNPADR